MTRAISDTTDDKEADRQAGRQAGKQAGDPMGTRSSTITTGIMRVGHESQAKLVGRRHPVGGGAVRI